MSGDPYIKENKELRAEIDRLRVWLGDSEMTVSRLLAALEEILPIADGPARPLNGLHIATIVRKALAKEGK